MKKYLSNRFLYMKKLLRTLALMKNSFITISNEQNEKKKRKRKIIWFNPPYSSTVKTNVGKLFLKLVKQHFPKGHKLHKIF